MNRATAIIITLIFFSSCALFRTPEQDSGYATRGDSQILFPEYTISLSEGDSSILHFRIPQSNLLFVKNTPDTFYTAFAELRFRLIPTLDGKIVDDSSTVTLIKVQGKTNDDWYGKIWIKVKQGYSGFLDIQFTDLNRKSSSRNVLAVDKRNFGSRDFYTLCRSSDTLPLFRNYLLANESAIIKAPGAIERLFVKYYRREFPLPPPPFSSSAPRTFSFLPDSTFSVEGKKGLFHVSLPVKGFYHFQKDTALAGITLYRFSKDFPFLTSAEGMIPVLRFITTRQEYDELSYGTNKENSMEDFWIRVCGNSERAKAVMSAYFGRAEQANHLFSSYSEGWRTDRGIVYVIFGKPNAVYRDPGTETWIYGEERSFKSLTFTFTRNDNPFTGNDYQLNRSELYKDEWYRGVDSWRQGRIYNDRP
jgi:GWxTD domain-containing protein